MPKSAGFLTAATPARSLALLLALCLAGPLSAPALADDAATIRAALAKVLPDYKATSVEATAIKGLYQVEIGPQILFMTGDGRFMIDGAIVDLDTREDITETARGKARLRAVNTVGEANMVVFPAAQPKHTITVFTDIDCGYCRKLHNEMAGYNAEGISVRYLFYPRAGANTPSYNKAVAVWCADDQRAALTDAKNGKDVPGKKCTNPVQKHMDLGELIGIRGTPAIVLDDGQLVPGYVEPKRLAQMLNHEAAN